MRLPFVKLLPGGNPTILLPGPSVPSGRLAEISARLMHPLHLAAEQVGALFADEEVPRLEMMGGEFCVNAARSAAFELALLGRFSVLDATTRTGLLRVSGLAASAPAAVALSPEALAACLERLEAVPPGPSAPPPALPLAGDTLYCAVRVPLDGARLEHPTPGTTLVRLPGICHLLLDEDRHPQPTDLFAGSRDLRLRHGLEAEPAAGVIWCRETPAGPAITPLVRVAATASVHAETACGSASLALALARKASTAVFQPSGEALSIRLGPARAWVSGPVTLVARGETAAD